MSKSMQSPKSPQEAPAQEHPALEPLAPQAPASAIERMVQMRRASGLTGANIVAHHQSGGPQRSPSGMRGEIQRTAQRGLEGNAGALPHLDNIQRSFGRHDVSGVRSFVGGAAREASDQMGAQAYATGDAVAFREAPDLHTAAHEAAHIVQQRGGVSLKDGVGQPGDSYERHADEVADAVVQGRSAEPILDRMAPARGPAPSRARGPVQMLSSLRGYDQDSQVNRDYQTLVREQEGALGGLRSQQSGTRTGTYGTIFEDAKAFAAQLSTQLQSRMGEAVQISPQVSLTLQDYGGLMGLVVPSTIRTNLQNPTQAEARAKQHMDSGGDVFGAFEGRWRGEWHNREQDGRQRNVGTFDHDWQSTEPSRQGSQVLTQPVVMGSYDASQPARGPGEGIQSGSPTAAINAVDRETGIITGAVGVSGGEADRPHAGYFVNESTLIWVARESDGGDNILYSCFFEHRRPAARSAGQAATGGVTQSGDGAVAQSAGQAATGGGPSAAAQSGAIPAGSYVIMGLQFRWNRSSQRLTVERLMGGLYTTPPSQQQGGAKQSKP